ncbi:unnamed protein product [Pieris macdunnoughi]|uniref:FLYWCH-type domain-containing protein n=1 Tax=Pieris macdunnoughi TaxID=345717 RepID=A0A821Q5D5_9NEOP|nr:unnamed protein product [Pieris macdunnoughi]
MKEESSVGHGDRKGVVSRYSLVTPFALSSRRHFFIELGGARYLFTPRGGKLLLYGGNTYFVNCRKKQERARVLWYCSSRKSRSCPASILTIYDRVLGQPPVHTHPPKMSNMYLIAQMSLSARLKPIIIHDGCRFLRQKVYKYTIRWVCGEKRKNHCKASLVTTMDNIIVKSVGFHNHF